MNDTVQIPHGCTLSSRPYLFRWLDNGESRVLQTGAACGECGREFWEDVPVVVKGSPPEAQKSNLTYTER